MTPRLMVESRLTEHEDSIDAEDSEEVFKEEGHEPKANGERGTCLNCRRSKVKCDRAWPTCGR